MANIPFGTNIDLSQCQILNFAIQVLESAPSSPVVGQTYFNSVDSTLRYYNGTEWITVAKVGDIPSGVELQANKGIANGYCGLDANAMVALANLPVGNDANKIVKLGAQLTSGQLIQYNGESFVGFDLGTVYVFRGSVATYADLPSTGVSAGDVYNVIAAYGDYPAGTNWAWDGTQWDPLGGPIDLSSYATTQYVDTQLALKADAVSATAGSYSKVTINSQGIVTAGTTAQISDISGLQAAIDTAQTTVSIADQTATAYLAAVSATGTSSILKAAVSVTTGGELSASITGNAATATALATARSINVEDADGTNVGTAASFDGTAGVVIKLPSTIKASLTGNADTATSATTATTASKLGTSTVGGEKQLIYLSSGVATASTSSEGSTTTPVFLDNGILTACGSSLAVSITGNAATATNATNDASGNSISATYATKAEIASMASIMRTTITGSGSASSFTINHSFGAVPMVQVFDSTNAMVFTSVVASSTNVVISFAVAPAEGATYSVVLVG